jgi:hypothetical protein
MGFVVVEPRSNEQTGSQFSQAAGRPAPRRRAGTNASQIAGVIRKALFMPAVKFREFR